MPKTVRLEHTGGPEVLKIEEYPYAEPGTGQVWIEHEAIGVNYLDAMQRNGSAPFAIPNGLGLEAAGRITKVGPDVGSFSVGDRVAYILGTPGAYSSGRIYPASRLIRLPDFLSFDEAAAILFKGITAQYLLHSTYPVAKGSVVLIYGAASALGQVLVPWAKHLGATVLGVVSREASIERARVAGCDEVLLWGEDLADSVVKMTGGAKVDVVYDGIGKDTFETSLNCLKPRGLLASIGASSGPPATVEVSSLNAKGSLYLTRPGLAAYASDINEYLSRASRVLQAVSDGVIRPNIWRSYPLLQVRDVHSMLDAGTGEGAIILTP